MAATMDGVHSGVTLSFPITKMERTPDGDLLVYGKATDGTVDSDKQIVDPEWSGKALQDWLSTGGNVRVQHSPHLYPAGKGVEVQVGKDGAHWVRSLIVEKTAKDLVEKGVLTAYSVGIAQPQIVRSYEAPGGKIVGGIIAELSLVDRPANKNCAFQLCKSAANGEAEFVGKILGADDDFIGKVGPHGFSHGWVYAGAPGNLPTKGLGDRKKSGHAQAYNRALGDIKAHEGGELDAHDHFNIAGHHSSAAEHAKALGETDRAKHHEAQAALHRQAGLSFARPDSPVRKLPGNEDLPQRKFTPGDMADLLAKRSFSQDERDSASDSGAALPNGSYPIYNQKDADNAARLAMSGHGDADAAKRHIRKRVQELGLKLPDSMKTQDADVTKGEKDCPSCGKGYDADSKQRSCEGCGTKLPAANKSAQPTDGVRAKESKGLPRHREPDGGVMEEFEGDAGLEESDAGDESPSDGLQNGIWDDNRPKNTPDTMKSASYAVARLHDALCSAYHPDDVAEAYPAMKGLIGAINDAWNDLDEQGRYIVKQIGQASSMGGDRPDVMLLDEARVTLSKAFGDMYPNVRITPGTITAGQFTRPYLSAGHPNLSASNEGGHNGPGQAGFGSTDTMRDADQFNRGNLHPHTGGGGNSIPGSRSASARLAAAAKQSAANAMQVLHDHLADHHAYLCPTAPASPDQLQALSKAETDDLRQQIVTLEKRHADQIDELRKMIDQLGGQPDPGAAPHRGITAVNKSASGGTGPADRRSLVEEAMTTEDRDRQAFLATIAASGDVGLREAALSAMQNR